MIQIMNKESFLKNNVMLIFKNNYLNNLRLRFNPRRESNNE
jgi:hypothetical protein